MHFKEELGRNIGSHNLPAELNALVGELNLAVLREVGTPLKSEGSEKLVNIVGIKAPGNPLERHAQSRRP